MCRGASKAPAICPDRRLRRARVRFGEPFRVRRLETLAHADRVRDRGAGAQGTVDLRRGDGTGQS